jgi:hypothetical protein
MPGQIDDDKVDVERGSSFFPNFRPLAYAGIQMAKIKDGKFTDFFGFRMRILPPVGNSPSPTRGEAIFGAAQALKGEEIPRICGRIRQARRVR